MTPDRIRLLAQVASLVYQRQPRLEGWTFEPVFRGSTEAYIVYNNTDLIIAFRGSDSQEDWKLDFRFSKVSVPGVEGKAHQGFSEALEQVFWQLLSKLHFRAYNRKVWVTGHSLGGALAVLFAARLIGQQKSHKIDGVLTLGAPRVLNVGASLWYDYSATFETLQIENDGDEVTHVPLAMLGYKHVGKRKVLMGRETTNRLWQWLKRWTFFTKRVIRTRILHTRARYLRRIERWLRTTG